MTRGLINWPGGRSHRSNWSSRFFGHRVACWRIFMILRNETRVGRRVLVLEGGKTILKYWKAFLKWLELKIFKLKFFFKRLNLALKKVFQQKKTASLPTQLTSRVQITTSEDAWRAFSSGADKILTLYVIIHIADTASGSRTEVPYLLPDVLEALPLDSLWTRQKF